MRVLAAALAAVVAATMAWSSAEAVDVQIDGFPFVCKSPEGEFLKPKFGDVDGIYFTGLPAARKPCLETIDRMIYSCTANTTFISHDLNNQYPDCLPTFERQAEQCVRHFEQERQKCYADDSSTPDQPAAEVVSSSRDDAGDVEIKGFSFGCTTPDGETRKPWYGGVDGTRFADLPSEREACLSLLSHKISSCRKNISFADHRQNRTFAACLPIFKGQVQDCVRHFEQERHKCYAGDSSAPAATTAEPKEPEVEPADLTMWAAKRSNIRSGPGTDHAKVGLLEVGDEVQVTGEISDWLRIAAPGGGEAFVYAPLLAEEAPETVSATAGAPGRLCARDDFDTECWREIAESPGCHIWLYLHSPILPPTLWSGSCRNGVADGKGVLIFRGRKSSSEQEYIYEEAGIVSRGYRHGKIVGKDSDGYEFEAEYKHGKMHGRWINYRADGSCAFVVDKSEGKITHIDEECSEYLASNSADTATVLEPKCAGMAEGSQCWGEFAERPGCYAWTHYWLQDAVITSWTGRCEDGMADGDGMLRTSSGLEAPATFVAGKATNVGSFDYVEGPFEQTQPAGEQLAADTTENKGRAGIEVEETTASGSSAVSDTGRLPAEGGAGAPRIPVDATHCVKLHENSMEYGECVDKDGAMAPCDGSNRWFYRYEIIDRSYENTCDKPIILRVRNFAKYSSEGRRSYVYDNMFPANYRPDYSSQGFVLEVNNTHLSDDEFRTHYQPPSEIAYCAEFVDTDITPEYLYNERYRLHEGSGFGSYSGVVEHLKGQGIKVGPEMRAYYDAYFDSLEHSPCYAEVVREPPIDYEHFPPLDWYEVSRMSLFVTFHTQGGGFEALSFDEESDFGGVTFHDVGGTDTHYISDLPKPSVRRN